MARPVLVVALALAALLVPAAASAQSADPTPVLRVVGHGIAQVQPDTAEIGVAVRRVDRDRDTARRDVARRARALLAALDGLGVPRADVQTEDVSLNRRTYKKAPRVRWAAGTRLTVTLRDVAAAGRVVDALAEAGADDVDGPYFTITNPSAGAAQAEQSALADARTRADAIAATLGMRVAGVRSVDLSPGEGQALFDESGGGDSDAALASAAPERTPVETGRETVYAAVAVIYVLAPA